MNTSRLIIGFAAIMSVLLPYQVTKSAEISNLHTRTPASLSLSALSTLAHSRELTTHLTSLTGRFRNTATFVPLTSLDLSNVAVVNQITNDQGMQLIGGTLQTNAGIAVGGTLILTPKDLAHTLSAEDIPANVSVTFVGFKSSNPIAVALKANSTTTQVNIFGTETFTGAGPGGISAAVMNITSNQAGPALVTTGALSSDGSIEITSNAGIQLGGPVTAATTLNITATQGSIAVNNALTATTTTLNAKASQTASNLAGSISVLPFNLSGLFGAFQTSTLNLMTGGGDIAASGGPALTNASTIATTIKGLGSAYLWDSNATAANGITLSTTAVGGTFSLFTTGSSSDQTQAVGSITTGAISASSVSLSTQGTYSSILISKSWGNANALINLTASGFGNISETTSSAVLTASTLNLTAVEGNIGTFTKFPNLPLQVSAATLSVNLQASVGGGVLNSALVTNKSTSLTLNSSTCTNQATLTLNTKGTLDVVGGVTAEWITLQASSNITVNAIVGGSGNIQDTIISGGVLTVNNDLTCLGPLILESSNTSSGRVVISPGVILASSLSSINVVIGPVPTAAQLIAGTTPPNVQYGSPSNFPIYFGAKGITTLSGPIITLETPNGQIVFNTGKSPASAISVGSGVTINAGYLTAASDDSPDIVNTGDDGQ